MPNTNRTNLYRQLSQQEQGLIREIREHERRGYEDPVYFAEWHLGLTLHEGQKKWLRLSDPIANKQSSRKNLLLPANRWGKTVALALKHIRFNYYKIGLEGDMTMVKEARYYTLDISPHSAQIDACYNYILDILQNRFPVFQKDDSGTLLSNQPKKPNECRIPDFYEGHNVAQHQIRFSNNSTFFGASTGEDQAASLAGKAYGYISYDECVLSHHLESELFGRIFSRTFDLNAPVDLVSTFDLEGKSQQYLYHLLRGAIKGENEWTYHLGVMDDNIFIPFEARESKKRSLQRESPQKYRQVVLGEAISSSNKCFTPEVIEQIWAKNISAPLKDQPIMPEMGHLYLISVDWGFAEQGDPTIMLVIDYSVFPYKIVHHEKMQGVSPMIAFAALHLLRDHFFTAFVIMDTNSLGGQVIKKMLRDSYGVKSYDFDAHGGEKGEAIIELQMLLQEGRKSKIEDNKIIEDNPDYGGLRGYYIRDLEEELADYEIEDKHLTQDFVVSLYQAVWWIRKKRFIPAPQTYNISLTGKIKAYGT